MRGCGKRKAALTLGRSLFSRSAAGRTPFPSSDRNRIVVCQARRNSPVAGGGPTRGTTCPRRMSPLCCRRLLSTRSSAPRIPKVVDRSGQLSAEPGSIYARTTRGRQGLGAFQEPTLSPIRGNPPRPNPPAKIAFKGCSNVVLIHAPNSSQLEFLDVNAQCK